jgi:hypothetical protein
VPEAVFTYIPPTSQTGAKVHGEITITIPRIIRIIAGHEIFIDIKL